MRTFVGIIILVLILILVCCNTSTNPDSANSNPPNYDDPVYTLQDLEEARLRGDCWTAINGKVYDITEFVIQHPGGNIINEDCGKDATTLFETRPMGSGKPHSTKAREMLEKYYIGKLKQN